MRSWHPIPPHHLCRNHLLGEWKELWGLYSIVTNGKQGYRNHPETKRWLGRPLAVLRRLHLVREEMLARNYNPKPLPLASTGQVVRGAPMPAPLPDTFSAHRAKAAAGCGCTHPNMRESYI